MKANINYECEYCGAVLSDIRMRLLQKEGIGDICPFCHDRYSGYRDPKLKNVFCGFTNTPDWDFEVEAVFAEHNRVSNPRLVVRFADHYFNDWHSLKFPDGFKVVCIRDSQNFPRPIELIFYFDAFATETADDFHSALDRALNILLDWIRRFPVLKE